MRYNTATFALAAMVFAGLGFAAAAQQKPAAKAAAPTITVYKTPT